MKYLPFILLIAGAVAAVYFLYYKPKQEQAAAETQKAMDDLKSELFTVPGLRIKAFKPELIERFTPSETAILSKI